MTGYALRRLGFSAFVLWGALTIVFVTVRVVPGDPALLILGADASPQQLSELRERFGLNQPLAVQYVDYLAHAVRLDFGSSVRLDSPAMQEVLNRLPATSQLAAISMLTALILSFPLGIAAALRHHSALDGSISLVSLMGQATPNFWLGIMFILLFARALRWLPSGGSGGWQNIVLPALTLALPLVGILTRLIRSGLLDTLAEDYIRTGRAKGLHPGSVLTRHALPNMLIPVITVVGLQLGQLLGGAVIVETVFSWPGVGRLLVDAISNRDYPLVQAAILLITTGFVLINLLVDLSYGYLDPRIRLQ